MGGCPMAERDLRDAPHLFVDAFRQFSSLIQNEVQLAKAELKANLSRAGTGVAFLAIAAIVALVALNVLASALVAAIAATGLAVGWAALIVGGGLLVLCAILVIAGKSRLSASALEPSRTIENVERDMASIKEATHA